MGTKNVHVSGSQMMLCTDHHEPKPRANLSHTGALQHWRKVNTLFLPILVIMHYFLLLSLPHSSSSFVSAAELMEIKPLFVCLASVRANVINLSAPLSSFFLFLILNAMCAADFVCNDVCEPLKGQKKPCGFAHIIDLCKNSILC